MCSSFSIPWSSWFSKNKLCKGFSNDKNVGISFWCRADRFLVIHSDTMVKSIRSFNKLLFSNSRQYFVRTSIYFRRPGKVVLSSFKCVPDLVTKYVRSLCSVKTAIIIFNGEKIRVLLTFHLQNLSRWSYREGPNFHRLPKTHFVKEWFRTVFF